MWNLYVPAPLLLITCDFVTHRNTYPLKIGHGQLKRKANDNNNNNNNNNKNYKMPPPAYWLSCLIKESADWQSQNLCKSSCKQMFFNLHSSGVTNNCVGPSIQRWLVGCCCRMQVPVFLFVRITCNWIGHWNYWNYLLIYWKFPLMLIQHSVNSDWLFNTQSRVTQADWFILEFDGKATSSIRMLIDK